MLVDRGLSVEREQKIRRIVQLGEAHLTPVCFVPFHKGRRVDQLQQPDVPFTCRVHTARSDRGNYCRKALAFTIDLEMCIGRDDLRGDRSQNSIHFYFTKGSRERELGEQISRMGCAM